MPAGILWAPLAGSVKLLEAADFSEEMIRQDAGCRDVSGVFLSLNKVGKADGRRFRLMDQRLLPVHYCAKGRSPALSFVVFQKEDIAFQNAENKIARICKIFEKKSQEIENVLW